MSYMSQPNYMYVPKLDTENEPTWPVNLNQSSHFDISDIISTEFEVI